MRVKFVDSALRSLRPRQVKYDVHDPADTNLLLRISPDGRKSWMVRFKSATGIMRQRPIGKYPMMPIDEAREVALSVVSCDQAPESHT